MSAMTLTLLSLVANLASSYDPALCAELRGIRGISSQVLSDAGLRDLIERHCASGDEEQESPTSDCRVIGRLYRLARLAGATPEMLGIIGSKQVSTCAMRQAGSARWANGVSARIADGTWRYPDRTLARLADGTWRYPTGVVARFPDGTWRYPDASTARTPDGEWRFPDGKPAQIEELIEFGCGADRSCLSNLLSPGKDAQRDDVSLAIMEVVWFRAHAR